MSVSRPRLSRHGRHRAAAPWVLALLCLRALLPAGYMLAPVAGHAAVILCDGGPAPHPHAHHGHSVPTCPFAQSAGPAPPPAGPSLAAPPVATALAGPACRAQTCPHPGPARQQSPRAPPVLA
ncbi:MAG: hypothetical protein JO341_13355 [Gammaproteobacteria bacterium]|nr:hypothetical protein [Gammaproteobacteria bacterium]MBV9621992.1 hypothetical protein [Gammaproteobacteria bacterium]